MGNKRTKKSISLEGFVFLAIFLGIFGVPWAPPVIRATLPFRSNAERSIVVLLF